MNSQASNHRPFRSIGLVGAGFHASTNLHPALLLGGVPIAGLATRDAERSTQALQKLGSDARGHDSLVSLVADPAVGRVLVCAQPEDQVDLALAAVAAGCDVLVEKPLGLTSADARRVARAADAAGVAVSVAFMKRHAPVYRELRDRMRTGELGTVRSFSISFGCDSTPFCANEREFLTLAAIHMVDLVRFLFGEVASLSATRSTDGPRVAIAASVTMASGAVGTLELVGLPGRSSETESVRVDADGGWMQSTELHRLEIHRAQSEASWGRLTESTEALTPAESAMSGAGRDLHLRGFVDELQAFSLDGRADCDAWSNVRTMELCERILDASTPVPTSAPPLEFGPPGRIRDEFIERIRSGAKSGSTTLRASYEKAGSPVPAVGDRRSVLDSDGRVAVVIEYCSVLTAPLGMVPDSYVVHEVADREQWLRSHLEYFSTLEESLGQPGSVRTGTALVEDEVVATTFRVVG
ncbi:MULTISPECIES: Gfo/Idh/MocA family oxidoreductase [unclassified Rathayibacter]|uniref:Gfo/Idh/MocA family oxidoreductase n=1 Tax=unclassified Rathayibacter TaxID=2609250 RepID=UPI000F4B81B5|nr:MULTISPECIES: Gfo/Idh/MocA family oxidoreductase [unclassified Rathayibacter]ROP49096.1 putative dehydrogenase [Rathayibacter sp. PhB186]ROS50787.1 putative dehydrogenase [Rathayibacter sp. PhB185]